MVESRLPAVAWPKVRLADIAVVQTGVAKGAKTLRDPIELPYLRVANVQAGALDLTDIKKISVSRADVSRYSLRPGDVLMTEGGDFDKLGRGTIWTGEICPCLHQNHVFAVRCDPTRVLPKWLSWVSGSHYGRRYFMLCSKQSTNLASINSTQLKAFPLPLPSLTQQQRISTVIESAESQVASLSHLVAAKRSFKRGLMQQLLTGKKRFPEFQSQPWVKRRLGEYFVEKSDINSDRSADIIYSCTKTSGIVLQSERFGKRLASADLARYKVVERGDLVYDPMLLWDGSIGFVPNNGRGVVSPAYETFIVNDNANRDYFWPLLKSYSLLHRYTQISQGTNERRRKAHPKDFLKLVVPMPPTNAEQDRIAAVLTAAQTEIDLLVALREKIEAKKRSLLSSLLTGSLRVPP